MTPWLAVILLIATGRFDGDPCHTDVVSDPGGLAAPSGPSEEAHDATGLSVDVEVTPLSVTQGESVDVTLRVINTNKRPTIVVTGAGITVQVLNRNGMPVWSYPPDAAELPAARPLVGCFRRLLPGRPAVYRIRWSSVGADGRPVRPGQYQVRAFIYTRPSLKKHPDLRVTVRPRR